MVDVWDALSSDRPYRKGWPPGEVLAYVRAGVRTHFDPRVVAAFLQFMAESSGLGAAMPSPGA